MKIEDAIAEVKAMHNDICIVHDSSLGRCVGFHSDAWDYYYIISPMNKPTYYATFVGACVSLKGTSRHDQLDATFAINGSLPTKEFLITKASDEENEQVLRACDEQNAKAFGMTYEEYIAYNKRSF